MILLEHHKSAKREIIARFQQLAEVAEGVGMVTLARDIRTTRIPNHHATLAKAGLTRIAHHHSLAGLLTTELWQTQTPSDQPTPLP